MFKCKMQKKNFNNNGKKFQTCSNKFSDDRHWYFGRFIQVRLDESFETHVTIKQKRLILFQYFVSTDVDGKT